VRRVAVTVAVAVLAAGCVVSRAAVPGSGPKPTCDVFPGRGVEGFVLERTQPIDEQDHVAVRHEYLDPRGRLLVYLLGVHGEVGEGSPDRQDVALVDGTPARFLGGRGNWVLVWNDHPPCPQVAVVGNGFRREDFARLLVEAHLLPPQSVPVARGSSALTEWVAVLRTSTDLTDLAADTDVLMETASRNLIVGPVGCHLGLAHGLDISKMSYFSGVVAEDRAELDRALTEVIRHPDVPDEPLLTGEFEVVCLAH
jgi:hypothetical protein